MSSASTIGLVAGSSVLAAVLTQGSSAVRDWLKRRRDASFSALFVALNLEAFARACSAAISESHTFEASEGSAGSARGSVPEKASFAEEVDWDVIGIDLTTSCLSLAVEIDTANEEIADCFEWVDEDAGIFAMRSASARLGCHAYDLAATLRKQFGVEPLPLNSEWNFVTNLKERKAEYDDIARRRAEADSGRVERMNAALDEQEARSTGD